MKQWTIPAGAFLAVALAVAVFAFQGSPSLPQRIGEPEQAAPAASLVFSFAGDGGSRLVRKLNSRKDMAAFLRSESAVEARRLLFDGEVERLAGPSRWFTPKEAARMFRGKWLAASYNLEGKKNLLFMSKLGLRQRIGVKIMMMRNPAKEVVPGYRVGRKIRGGGRELYFALGGGWLFVSTDAGLLRRAIEGAGGDGAIANDAKYVKYRKAAGEGPTWFRQYAPGANVSSKLTAAKFQYAALYRGSGGALLRFVGEPVSGAPAKNVSSLEFAGMFPKSASVFFTTAEFGRIWDDLLLGRAIRRERTGIFLQDFIQFDARNFGKIFTGRTAVGLDGVIKLSDSAPMPNVFFIFESTAPILGAEAARKILAASLKDHFHKKVTKIYSSDVTSYVSDDKDAALSPSVAVAPKPWNAVIFTLTAAEMRKALAAASGFSPCLKDRPDMMVPGSRKTVGHAAFFIVDGNGMSKAGKRYFELFADISGQSLAEALRKIVIPAIGKIPATSTGVGWIDYRDGLLIGEYRMRLAPEKNK